ncbi:hypothetical protein TRVA0_006S02058 [Trichomonascus vanleenenianus]|uniref:uncharacterized protein n=1 Tax=Trichomonascus vanleenenianus TaxID=2268995 RepID=UPI003ECAE804
MDPFNIKPPPLSTQLQTPLSDDLLSQAFPEIIPGNMMAQERFDAPKRLRIMPLEERVNEVISCMTTNQISFHTLFSAIDLMASNEPKNDIKAQTSQSLRMAIINYVLSNAELASLLRQQHLGPNSNAAAITQSHQPPPHPPIPTPVTSAESSVPAMDYAQFGGDSMVTSRSASDRSYTLSESPSSQNIIQQPVAISLSDQQLMLNQQMKPHVLQPQPDIKEEPQIFQQIKPEPMAISEEEYRDYTHKRSSISSESNGNNRPWIDRTTETLRFMRDQRLSLSRLCHTIVTEPEFKSLRTNLLSAFKDDKVLRYICSKKQFRQAFEASVESYQYEDFASVISREIEQIHRHIPLFHGYSKRTEMDPEMVHAALDRNEIMASIKSKAPYFYHFAMNVTNITDRPRSDIIPFPSRNLNSVVDYEEPAFAYTPPVTNSTASPDPMWLHQQQAPAAASVQYEEEGGPSARAVQYAAMRDTRVIVLLGLLCRTKYPGKSILMSNIFSLYFDYQGLAELDISVLSSIGLAMGSTATKDLSMKYTDELREAAKKFTRDFFLMRN